MLSFHNPSVHFQEIHEFSSMEEARAEALLRNVFLGNAESIKAIPINLKSLQASGIRQKALVLTEQDAQWPAICKTLASLGPSPMGLKQTQYINVCQGLLNASKALQKELQSSSAHFFETLRHACQSSPHAFSELVADLRASLAKESTKPPASLGRACKNQAR